MYRNNSTKLFSTIFIIVIVIAVVVGLVAVGRMLFGGGNGDGQRAAKNAQQIARDNLLNTSEGRSVRVTGRGPIVANEEFIMQRAVISPTERKAYLYSGYLGEIKNQVALANTVPGYDEFVHALDKGEFTKPGKQLSEEQQDVRGICAKGRVYEYEILDGTEVLWRAWTSTCKGSPGSFGASTSYINDLFSRQFPEDKYEFSKY